MKRIFIEASSFYGRRSGVGRYGLSVTENLIAQREKDTFTLFSFLRPGRTITRDFSLPPNARIKYIRWFPGRAFSLLMRSGISLPLELYGLWRADMLIFPNFIAWASLMGKKRICVVHDIAFEFFPELVQAKNLAYLKRQMPRSLKRSDAVVAVSEATKRDLVKHYGVPADKISVVYNAADTSLFNPEAKARSAEVRDTFGIPADYLLFVGNVEPRKNLVSLLRAYARSYQNHKLALVIVGAKGWNDSGIDAQFRELTNLPIYRTDFVSDIDLPALYAGATAFVYPSLYEGFGIPCLEAMACGCPVICGNNSSFPEVVGDAAYMVDAKNIDAIAGAIVRLAANAELRQKLRRMGIVQAKKFTWENSARQLSALIDTIL